MPACLIYRVAKLLPWASTFSFQSQGAFIQLEPRWWRLGRAITKESPKTPVIRSEAAAHSIAASYLAALMIRVPGQKNLKCSLQRLAGACRAAEHLACKKAGCTYYMVQIGWSHNASR